LNVCLVNPRQPELKRPTAYIPLGLSYIAAMLEKHGIKVAVSDQPESTADIPEADIGEGARSL